LVVEAYRQALEAGDGDAALSLCAVPDCCRAFHRRLPDGDPAGASWASAAATPTHRGADDGLWLEAAPHTNRFLAPLGHGLRFPFAPPRRAPARICR
jgi:hypothetical protein